VPAKVELPAPVPWLARAPSAGSVAAVGRARARRAIPKSRTFSTPSARIMMFSGLMSRCTKPRLCAKASVAAMSSSHPRRVAIATSSPITLRSVRPSISSIARKVVSPTSPTSKIATTFGWSSAAAARASRISRTACPADSFVPVVAGAACSTLSATRRSSRGSNARYTSPIPPRPSSASIVYLSKRSPIASIRGEGNRSTPTGVTTRDARSRNLAP
jgi:hypothetical protein